MKHVYAYISAVDWYTALVNTLTLLLLLSTPLSWPPLITLIGVVGKLCDSLLCLTLQPTGAMQDGGSLADRIVSNTLVVCVVSPVGAGTCVVFSVCRVVGNTSSDKVGNTLSSVSGEGVVGLVPCSMDGYCVRMEAAATEEEEEEEEEEGEWRGLVTSVSLLVLLMDPPLLFD